MKQTALSFFFVLMVLGVSPAFGQGVRVGPDDQIVESTLSLPYAFYNENFGFAAGYVYSVVGRPQKQATLLATLIGGTNGSAMGFLVGRDLQMPRVERVFMDPILSVGYFKDAEAYIDGNPRFPGERAGSNDSDPDNYLTGGNSLNPLADGRSYLELRPFYRWLQIDGGDLDQDLKTNGLDFSVFWDNRDFYANPTYSTTCVRYQIRGRCFIFGAQF
jgi:hypothetical protein